MSMVVPVLIYVKWTARRQQYSDLKNSMEQEPLADRADC